MTSTFHHNESKLFLNSHCIHFHLLTQLIFSLLDLGQSGQMNSNKPSPISPFFYPEGPPDLFNFGPWTPINLTRISSLFWKFFGWTQLGQKDTSRQNGSTWLKSVHFKNTVEQSSVHSKIWSFSMIIILSELRIMQLGS